MEKKQKFWLLYAHARDKLGSIMLKIMRVLLKASKKNMGLVSELHFMIFPGLPMHLCTMKESSSNTTLNM